MKKVFAVIAGLIGIGVATGWFLTRSEKSPQAPIALQTSETIPAEMLEASETSAISEKNVALEIPLESAREFIAETKFEPEPATQSVTHSSRDDFSMGEFRNVIADEKLHLAARAKEVASDAPFIGIYVSSEDMSHRSFDRITFNYQATVPPGSLLKFEAHTVSVNGEWSEWQEIPFKILNQPIELETSATGWQYRFTFSAASVDESPQVERITITTERTKAVATTQ